MDPEILLKLIKENSGVRIEATDKSYKLYVHGVPREGNPDDLRVVSHTMGHNPNDRPGYGKYKSWKELTRAEKRAVKDYDNGWAKKNGRSIKDDWWQFTIWGETVEAKFYTGHFSKEQGDEFIKLWVEGKIPWGYPPYVRMYIPHTEESEEDSVVSHDE
jgi:hypothetical protein